MTEVEVSMVHSVPEHHCSELKIQGDCPAFSTSPVVLDVVAVPPISVAGKEQLQHGGQRIQGAIINEQLQDLVLVLHRRCWASAFYNLHSVLDLLQKCLSEGAEGVLEPERQGCVDQTADMLWYSKASNDLLYTPANAWMSQPTNMVLQDWPRLHDSSSSPRLL